MKTIKVSEATPLQLDWLVAKALDLDVYVYIPAYADLPWLMVSSGMFDYRCPEFSTDWPDGGPIIDLKIDQISRLNNYPEYTANRFACDAWEDCEAVGPTMLIAAMRCFVASELGEEAEVPDELG